jgi:hypothetical protein
LTSGRIGEQADTRSNRSAFSRVTGNGADCGSAGSSAQCAPRAGAGHGRICLLLLLDGLLLLLGSLFIKLKRIAAGFPLGPGVALTFILRLLRGGLTASGKGKHV